MSLAARVFGSDRGCLLFLLALGILLFAANLGTRDLWAPDEPGLGEVVREILLTGHWAVLQNNQHLYLEKPPLFPWLAAIASLPAGHPSEIAVRLPSCLAALLGLVVVFHLGKGVFGRRAGALAGVITATTYGFYMEACWAHTDMLWTFWLVLSCLAFHCAWRAGGDARWLAVFYLAIGMADLTKGPHGLLIPLLAVFVFLAWTRDLGFVRRMGLAWGLPLALVPVGAWVIAYVGNGESFPLGALLRRLARRFTSGEHHAEPFYEILISLPLEFFPWILLLPAAILKTFPRQATRPNRDSAYLYSWIIVIFTVFTASVEKRGVYLLPLLPLLAILVGRIWDLSLAGGEPAPHDRAIRWLLWISLALALGGSAVALRAIRSQAPDLLRPAVVLACIATLVVVAALVSHRLYRGSVSLATYSGGLVVLYLVLAGIVLPAVDPHKSARAFCRRILADVGDAPLAMYKDYHPVYVYYTERFMPVLKEPAQLREFLASPRRGYCLIEDEIYETERRSLDPPPTIVDRQKVGHREMLLVTGGGAAP
jgi:4-amino-4-deoxy-L-arabinose transferase-like glycosyltransferase